MQDKNIIIGIFIVCSLLVLVFSSFIAFILFIHQKKQNAFQNQLAIIINNSDKELLRSQVEMQEHTFQYIAREIHDNVGQFLSLAKLHLNTLNFDNKALAVERVGNSTELLSKAIADLRDLSRSMSAEVIRSAGLPQALQFQIVNL